MKGHKFDWRKKRRPPFCTFIDLGIAGYVSGYRPMLRMDRRWIGTASARRDPLVRWLGKRGTQRFVARNAPKSCLRHPVLAHARVFDAVKAKLEPWQ